MKKMFYLISAILLANTGIYAENTLHGTVKDANGDALLGSIVEIKGTNTYGITDTSGFFKISVADKYKARSLFHERVFY